MTAAAARCPPSGVQVGSDETSIEIGLVYQPFWAMFTEIDLDELSRIPFGLPLMCVYAPPGRPSPRGAAVPHIYNICGPAVTHARREIATHVLTAPR